MVVYQSRSESKMSTTQRISSKIKRYFDNHTPKGMHDPRGDILGVEQPDIQYLGASAELSGACISTARAKSISACTMGGSNECKYAIPLATSLIYSPSTLEATTQEESGPLHRKPVDRTKLDCR